MGDLTGNAASAGWLSWGVVWGIVLLSVTAVVGLLAAARARQLNRFADTLRALAPAYEVRRTPAE